MCFDNPSQIAYYPFYQPFISGESEHTPKVQVVEKLVRKANISDTDKGEELSEQIRNLRELLHAYKTGALKER